MDVKQNPVMPDYQKILDNMRNSVRRKNDDGYYKRLQSYNAAKFETELSRSTLAEFGERYVRNHKTNLLTSKDAVISLIQETLQNRQGFYFSGIPGSGKTHILLEFYRQILRKEALDVQATVDYPCYYPAWIRKTCKYYYSSWISDLIRNHEKPSVAKYNLIDDLFVEEWTNYTLSGWNAYVEEINRRDYVMIFTSNIQLKDLKDMPQYSRIISRIAGNCRNYELPTKDRRLLK